MRRRTRKIPGVMVICSFASVGFAQTAERNAPDAAAVAPFSLVQEVAVQTRRPSGPEEFDRNSRSESRPGEFSLGVHEVALSDGSTLTGITLRPTGGKLNGYTLAFQYSGPSEFNEAWRLDVRTDTTGMQTTTLKIDGILAYRISVGSHRDEHGSFAWIRTPRSVISLSDDDVAFPLGQTAVEDLERIASYRQIVYIALYELRHFMVLENADVTASSCASMCAEDHPPPADCTGNWDEFQCCIAEADKDSCRRACECGDSAWCMAWEIPISIFDHESCVFGLVDL